MQLQNFQTKMGSALFLSFRGLKTVCMSVSMYVAYISTLVQSLILFAKVNLNLAAFVTLRIWAETLLCNFDSQSQVHNTLIIFDNCIFFLGLSLFSVFLEPMAKMVPKSIQHTVPCYKVLQSRGRIEKHAQCKDNICLSPTMFLMHT